jgi:pimeloyl-ACP methyl ester carboxylesterase
MSRRIVARRLAFVVALGALGCGEQAPLPTAARPPAPRASNDALSDASSDAATVPGPWAQIVNGETGPGSLYRLYMPAAWNGKLLVYAHGNVAPFLPVTIPSEVDAFASLVGAEGYAVAASSFSETGAALKDGAQRTHQLRGLFAARFGQPSRTYLAGASMGGFIVTVLAEQFGRQYDGVLPVCGVVGGYTAEYTYLLHVRALFDQLYPNVLPGSPTSVPLPSDPSAAAAALAVLQAKAVGAILSDPRPLPGAVQIALIDQTRMPLPTSLGGPLTPQQFVKFVVTPLVTHAASIDDIVDHTHGHFPFTNDGTTYTSGAPFMAPLLPAINAGVARMSADPAGVNLLNQNGETSGQLGIPMLTLHTRYDPTVPLVTEALYRQKVEAAGHGNLLVQRTIDAVGHCAFTPPQLSKGFNDLVAWVEQGVKPAP